jgi:hypothetical protein
MVGGAASHLIDDHDRVLWDSARAAIVSDRRITDLSAEVTSELVAEIGPL